MDALASSLALTTLSLRTRFALLLGGIAVATLVLFLTFAQYALNQSEQQLERRGQLLAQTVGQQSVLKLVMGDQEGLQETLKSVVNNGSALAGGFFDPDGSLVAGYNLDETIPSAARHTAGNAVRWTEATSGASVLVAVSSIERGTEPVGRVLTVLPTETVQSQRQTSYLIAGGLFAGIALIALFVMWQLQRTVTRPVEALGTAARRVENGDLSVRVSTEQEDEIGALTASFNAMVEASETKTDALEEQSKRARRAREQAETLRQEAQDERAYLREQFDRISDVLDAVVRGDLTKRLTVDNDDAVGTLMKQVNAMIDELAALIREVDTASNQLSSAAQLAAASADEMSAGAQGQAEQTTEVAAAVEQMSATVASSSQHADRSNEMARQTSELAAEGKDVFDQTADGMERIATLVNSSADKVTALGESSAQIGEIVQVIEDIADQTNLLALNAAIEAARAGEHGKGFAVVADEVRQLAERTTSATQKIAPMITQIQERTNEVVASMERGTDEVERGLDLANEASGALTQIVRSIDEMVGMIDQIAAATQQQSAATNQISSNVEAISSVADEVSHATTDLAEMAVDMSQQAEDLNAVIERFTVDAAPSADTAPLRGDGAAEGQLDAHPASNGTTEPALQ
jgi:methyl-accepting chemotaxis protein